MVTCAVRQQILVGGGEETNNKQLLRFRKQNQEYNQSQLQFP